MKHDVAASTLVILFSVSLKFVEALPSSSQLQTRSAPILAIPLITQLNFPAPLADISSAYPLPSNNGVRVPAGWSFSVGFVDDTFFPSSDDAPPMSCSASNWDGTALPDWLSFQDSTLTLNGVTPHHPEFAPPLNISVACAENDASVRDSFLLVVDGHNLQFAQSLQALNVTPNSQAQYHLDWSRILEVEGQPGNDEDVQAVQVDLTNTTWLNWDMCVSTCDLIRSVY
jgi:hypothetical protein